MDLLAADMIRPLELAENCYLQVLLTQFSMVRRSTGVELKLRFDGQTPAIWLRQAKAYLNHEIKKSPEKRQKVVDYENRLRRFLLFGEGEADSFDDPDFPFRYGSGGTLPVIKMGSKQYYCFFYREVHPVGWNIANGGCDTRQELLNPWETVERELREELIVVDPMQKERYLLNLGAGKMSDHPDFATAWRLWRPRFRELNFPNFKEAELLVKWLGGPDCLKVQFAADEPVTIRGCFLNINAKDFGIEIDCVAKLNIGEEAILCDGEVINNRLQNRLIGLFEVERFNQAFKDEATAFVPDWVFYDAQRFTGAELEVVLQEYLNYIVEVGIELGLTDLEEARQKQLQYDLCPVTRSIVHRINQKGSGDLRPPLPPPNDPWEVFITAASEDYQLARSVYEYVCNNTKRRVYFSDETKHQTDFGREIDDALDSAHFLIAVASSPEYLLKEWVKFEWDGYHRDILSGKKRDAALFSVISGFSPLDLPRALRHREAIVCEPTQLEAKLQHILKFIN